MSDARAADDAVARAAALDVNRSFIVQAPAGSGKTELLIQRYLALLSRVERPEAIVAMTFTRKAAGEIRSRVIDALRFAADGTAPLEPHLAVTWSLARKVLEHDAALGWNLASHPARLQILTIDALCTGLMRQAPLKMKVGAVPRIEDRPYSMYVDAARAELDAAADDAEWDRLLDYIDNDAGRAVHLIADMLAKREQWLPHVIADDRAELRHALEAALRAEVECELELLAHLMPASATARMIELASHAGANLQSGEELHPLQHWAMQGRLPAITLDGLPHWRAIVDWLVTRGGRFRKGATKHEGFPAKGNASDGGYAERVARKSAMEALLGELRNVPGLESSLHFVRGLPAPTYDDAAWSFVEALLVVLPRAAARLQLVFAQAGAIDYSEATLIALHALGPADAPSDLLLSLDVRIAHLLVDEFQDTSHAQYTLVECLTSGWSVGDGRTLFVVGDPMQSIYRFREAEVGLFIAAQHDRRLGGVALEALTLTRNFRSQAKLVHWVNAAFAILMGEVDVPRRARVGFKAALPALPTLESPPITFDACVDAKSEALAVVARIEAALAGGAADVAILVRKRADLEYILPALRAAGVAFTSVDLDRLAQRQAILDLEALAHTLIQPDDRLSWLAVLRAPWCALALPDLFVVAEHAGKGGLVNALLTAPRAELLAQLSDDGRQRFVRFAASITPVLADRGRAPLATALRGLWLALGGPACVAESADIAAAERFFALLTRYQVGADVPDWAAFVDALGALYAEPEPGASAQVQVMTLHRAKGLEFDVVVMPGLGRRPRATQTQLLRWRRRKHGLVLAPMKRRAVGSSDEAAVYSYLKRLEKLEDEAELGRLLYVGSTRARHRLHFTAEVDIVDGDDGVRFWRIPPSGTALAALWPILREDLPSPGEPGRTRTVDPRDAGVPLLRLPSDWRLAPPPGPWREMRASANDDNNDRIDFDWVREGARQAGTFAHRLLHRVAAEGIDRWTRQRVADESSNIERDLAARGFTADERTSIARQVITAVTNVLQDARGRWLFDTRHRSLQSEFAVTTRRDDASFAHYVLDRTFVDDQEVRWIVDFKLSTHSGGGLEAFLASEQARYRPQLEEYARVMRTLDERPIRLGLYFPTMAAWREWDYAG